MSTDGMPTDGTTPDESKVQGVNTQSVLTGQVLADPRVISCRNHRVTEHTNGRWCNRCGRDDNGNLLGRPNGGWA